MFLKVQNGQTARNRTGEAARARRAGPWRSSSYGGQQGRRRRRGPGEVPQKVPFCQQPGAKDLEVGLRLKGSCGEAGIHGYLDEIGC